MGITAVNTIDGDTFAEEDQFFSYRRNTLAGITKYGRNLSAIALAE